MAMHMQHRYGFVKTLDTRVNGSNPFAIYRYYIIPVKLFLSHVRRVWLVHGIRSRLVPPDPDGCCSSRLGVPAVKIVVT